MPTPLDRPRVRKHLDDFTLQALFIEELGWDHGGEDMEIAAPDKTFSLQAIAQKRGMVVFQYRADSVGTFPDQPTRQKIERIVTKAVHEHLLVYATHDNDRQVWQWVKRTPTQPARSRQHIHYQGHSGEALIQKLEQLVFTLDEEADLTIPDVAGRVRTAFDVEKVTKRFYDRFRAELTAFGGFIGGITTKGDRDWYASLMLNRMMFVYFIQKQRFLDDDPDYLRNRLRMVQQQSGGGRFQQFYRIFLLRLFHEGLGQPKAQRASDLAALLGKVPFLNGGLFDVHDLERDNPAISIPDEAFKRVFGFFDGYDWHLDERPYREDNEINPDVLGYIFEKYVNQKQMGAYYTKEDITGYISRNTVVSFLFDAARRACPVAFGPDGGVWRLLRDDPDRYIYPAVCHGITWNARGAELAVKLDMPFDLPDDIAAGFKDISKRDGWNTPAPEQYALPTETWREVVARRQRYAEVRSKLAAGNVREINELITLNLDIEQFARDVIAQSEGPELLRAFWHAVRKVSVLDPTCGSGAFLFAALNVLEPLYTACLEGMQGFLDDLEHSEQSHHPGSLRDFRDVLKQVDRHPSERYFILKSIVLNNLYGVDIMEEAVEICKLRLFLKLVGQLESYNQIEPLPDIDFNIRAGNALVGFTSLVAVRQAMTITSEGQHRALFDEDRAALAHIEKEAEVANRAFNLFRKQQTTFGGEVTSNDKSDLRQRLEGIGEELNRLLAVEYGVKLDNHDAYEAWRSSHHPFHWFVEFYGIMRSGGFDVIVGNPPYVNHKAIGYVALSAKTTQFPDIYGYVVLQSRRMTNQLGRYGMIVPLSMTFSFEFSALRAQLISGGNHWFSSFDNIPAALFSGVSQRCTIWLGSSVGGDLFATRLFRWRSAYRGFLLDTVTYNRIAGNIPSPDFGIPRLPNRFSGTLLALHIKSSHAKSISPYVKGRTSPRLGFSTTARNFISTYIAPPPVLHADDGRQLDNGQCGWVTLPSAEEAFAALAIASSDTCFWYWLTRGDGFHVTNWLLKDLLAPLASLPTDQIRLLAGIGEFLHRHRYNALVFKKNAGKYVGNFNYQKLLPVTRKADVVFLSGLGASWTDIRELFSFVSLVRGINQEVGERNIPASVRGLFPPLEPIDFRSDCRLREVVEWISTTYSISPNLVDEMSSI